MRFIARMIILCLAVTATAGAQQADQLHESFAALSVAQAAENSYSSSREPQQDTFAPPISPRVELKKGFDWNAASRQSFYFLALEHGVRLTQRKTRREFGGKFFADYNQSVRSLKTWGDTDSVFTNYVAHPMQGGLTGFIQIQNDPKGITQEFGSSGAYWRSRTKAMAWAALYSTQFELGPISEASIGNVGKKPGTMGYVDLVITPVGGLGMIVLEDAVDKKWIEKMETNRTLHARRMIRMFMNPQRTFANVLRLKKPWHRDTRTISWDPAVGPKPTSAVQKNQ